MFALCCSCSFDVWAQKAAHVPLSKKKSSKTNSSMSIDQLGGFTMFCLTWVLIPDLRQFEPSNS